MFYCIFYFLIPLLSLGQLSVEAQNHADLTLQDIHPIMDKIFAEHVSEKKMNYDLMTRGIKQYIDTFDPDRCYLLAQEVSKYLNISKDRIAKLVVQYEKNDYTFFEEINKTIQNAIVSARLFREKDQFQSMTAVRVYLRENSRGSLKTALLPFAQKEVDLQERMRLKVAKAIDKEYQEDQVNQARATFEDLRAQAEAEIRSFENEYLYQDKAGKAVEPAIQKRLLAQHILKSLMTSLDAHSSFLNPKEAYELKMKLQKSFDGVGIELEDQGAVFVVSKLFPGSSAEKNGQLMVGDQLLAIDGQKVSTLELEQVLERLKGKTGTYVTLDLERRGGGQGEKLRKFSISLQRRQQVISEGRVDVSYEKFENGIIGKIVLHSFYQGSEGVSSEADMKKAILGLKKQGNLLGIILDLRDNRGGFLMQAVKVAGLFIKSGVVVIAKGNSGKEQYFRDIDPGVLFSGPLVILTSRITASAAEIVAQALKDYGSAIIVGDVQTYGKGTIQMQTVTGKVDDPSVKVTIGTYYSVSGVSTQLQGVKADVVVPSVFYNKKLGEEYLHFPVSADSVPAAFHDKLGDVDPEVKDWYVKYYKPHLQMKTTEFTKFIPDLQQKSQYRIRHNSDYQLFLNKSAQESIDKTELQKQAWNLQMQEGVNVLKDLIVFSKSNHS